MLEAPFQRPDYQAAASFIDGEAARDDVVIDETDYSPAPPTGIDAALGRRIPYFTSGCPACSTTHSRYWRGRRRRRT